MMKVLAPLALLVR